MSTVSVIIPALNEAESIGHVVASMPWHLIAECIVVDNGSTDATAQIARQAGARVITSPRGYGAACKAGSDAALSTSTILVYMDGDGSDIIGDLPQLITPILNDEADFVIASRIRGQREPGSMLPARSLPVTSSARSSGPFRESATPTWALFAPSADRHSKSYKCPSSPTAGT